MGKLLHDIYDRSHSGIPVKICWNPVSTQNPFLVLSNVNCKNTAVASLSRKVVVKI